MDLQKHWKDHRKVTDLMVAQLKENLNVDSDWGIRVITNDEHKHGFKEDIPEGYVAWLIIPPACRHLTGFFFNNDNVRYTSPSGDSPLHRRKHLLLKSKEEDPDTMVLVRLGKFYHFFDEDAIRSNTELDMPLSDIHPQPTTGFPCDKLDEYMKKFEEKNYRVKVLD